ncbi:MAG TPA: Zn-ribbon domain-containing OB-fold protein [Acidimicrobiia bacterium]|nr:Zn-ribbon domain-containing OB-fold protein [Acidimicrobiia bacterium]
MSNMAELRPGVFPATMQDPYADETTQPFWDAALEGRLLGYRCSTCGTFVMPPKPYCFTCQGTDFAWVELPGTGTVYTFTIVRHPLSPALAEVVPFAAGVIELDGTQGAGARMIANIVDVDLDTLQIGTRVKVVFDTVSDTLAVPRFAPV